MSVLRTTDLRPVFVNNPLLPLVQVHVEPSLDHGQRMAIEVIIRRVLIPQHIEHKGNIKAALPDDPLSITHAQQQAGGAGIERIRCTT